MELRAWEGILPKQYKGRVISAIVPDGAAENVGLEAGDIILSIDGSELVSQEDIDDVLRLHRPGDDVELVVKLAETGDVETITTTLGGKKTDVSEQGLAWDYAGLGQLPRALEEGRAKKKKVLIGLAGSGTC